MKPERFREYRDELGMTQEALADALGVAHATVWRWEHGKKPIGNPVILELALRCLLYDRRAGIDRLLGVEPKELLRDE